MSLSDPPSARSRRVTDRNPRRSADNASRRRSTDSPLSRSEDDHKSGKSAFGALITVVIAVLFLGYIFNVAGFATAADAFFSGLDASAKSENDIVVRVTQLVYPAVVLLVAALVLFGVLRFIYNRFRSAKKNRNLAGREVITLETFKKVTGARGIRPRIATQAYELLLPFYSSSMRARLDDRLVEDLHLTPVQVQDVYGNLLRNTDRKAPVGETITIVSVMDLLNAAQNAKRHSLMDSVVRPIARISGIRRAQRDPQQTDKDAPKDTSVSP